MSYGAGCDNCYDSGYKGRSGIYEMLGVDAQMRQLILANASLDEIREARRASGLPSLKEAGFEPVRKGISTIEEVMRAVFIESQSDVAALSAPAEPDTPALPTPEPAVPVS